MASEPTTVPRAMSTVRAWQVYSMAAIYLAIGLVIGYVLRVSRSPASAASASALKTAAARPTPGTAAGTALPTPDQMRQMADKHTAPLIEKLKRDPNDTSLLMQLGAIYHSAHQFKQAADYYGRAVAIEPKNHAARTKLAISLYREGDVDGAIAQLNFALKDDPGDANALFNLGMIRWQGKQDGAGALQAWQLLLKSNPQLPDDHRAEVQQLIAGVQASLGKPNRNQGAKEP